MMRPGIKVATWIILILLQAILMNPVTGSEGGISSVAATPDALDDYIGVYVNKTLKQARTGTVYKVSLPQSYTGIDVSFVRLRSSTFWVRGVNFSYFRIPPRIIPRPYVKRLVIVFDNLQNLSSQYYQVPGYKLVAPVLGFSAYDASNNTALGSQKLTLDTTGLPISIHFPGSPETHTNAGLIKCITFGTSNNSFEISNTTSTNVCSADHQGRYSLIVPSKHGKNRDSFWKWWVVGFAGGFVVLVTFLLLVYVIFRLVVRRRIKEMEKESERGVPLDTFYIGDSKMPSASMIRTQPPAIETNEYYVS